MEVRGPRGGWTSREPMANVQAVKVTVGNARQHVVWDSMDVAWGAAIAPKQRVLFQQFQEFQTISASNGRIFR